MQTIDEGSEGRMSERTYPRKVWVLLPSFRPIEVEVVKRYGSSYSYDYGDLSDKGKLYSVPDMHESEAAAIKAGATRLKEQRARLEKQLTALAKREATLAAALAKATGAA